MNSPLSYVLTVVRTNRFAFRAENGSGLCTEGTCIDTQRWASSGAKGRPVQRHHFRAYEVHSRAVRGDTRLYMQTPVPTDAVTLGWNPENRRYSRVRQPPYTMI